MELQSVQRKLTAILSADVKGYSRLMGEDEVATIRTLTAYRELMATLIREHRGRVVDSPGDNLLAEFASVVEAVQCAVEIQQELKARNAELPQNRRMEFRIGVNLGDVIVEEERIYGDGINIAARVEGLAEGGGICISGTAYDHVENKLELEYQYLGEQAVKNIKKPVRVYRVVARESEPRKTAESSPSVDQHIRFCTASDGTRIAYALVGQGPPIVKSANWMNHLEFDWESPVWRHMFEELSRDHLLVRYDARGNGLSDWDVDDISFDAFVRDLEAVVDETAPDRFALLGISQGCAVSVAYTVRHPERVSHLVLYGGYVKGWRLASPEVREKWVALNALIRQGWGQDNPAFRQMFTALFMPGATPEQMRWFNELQRASTSPENALRIREALADVDVEALLPKVSVPTLVLHARDDAVVPFKSGREYAMGIPGAQFVPLEGQNHLLIESEPAWPRFLSEVRAFLANG